MADFKKKCTTIIVKFGFTINLNSPLQKREKDHLNLRVFTENRGGKWQNGKMIALQISPKIEFVWNG